MILKKRNITIDCVADLHGFYPKLEGGDILIVAGDLTASNKQWQYMEFRNWLQAQDYKHKIVVAGNHDGSIEDGSIDFTDKKWLGATYLRDSGTIIEDLTFWGSPWTTYFDEVNPHCAAFMKPDKILSQYWEKIPYDLDILITHSPPFGILDGIPNEYDGTLFHAGSKTLMQEMMKRKKMPEAWIFGHIHEAYEQQMEKLSSEKDCKMINCSYVNARYKPVNKPIRVIL